MLPQVVGGAREVPRNLGNMDERPYKIVLAGRHGVGKSSIFKELQIQADGYGMGMQTVDVGTGTKMSGYSGRGEREKWMVRVSLYSSGRDVTAILWDTGGMERHGIKCMTRSYFAGSSGPVGVILVYDTGDMESLHSLKDWIAAAREHNGTTTGSSVVFSLWGNTTGNDDNPVEYCDAQDFARRYGISSQLIFTVNASNGDKLLDSFQTVVDALHLMDTNPRRAKESYGTTNSVSLLKSTREQPESTWKSICGC